jgi:hypothetical protein
MNVLIACEESQTVCKAFRALGHRAFSADLQECSGGHPEWHVMGDCLPLLNGRCKFTTQDGREHEQPTRWDLLIAHPPCTYMSKAGARWMYPKAGQLSQERLKLAMEARDFFFKMYDADCEYIAIENPRPLAIVQLPNPSTVVQPYEFGEPFSKATYLWLKNLPPLMPTLFCANIRRFSHRTREGARKVRSGHAVWLIRQRTHRKPFKASHKQWRCNGRTSSKTIKLEHELNEYGKRTTDNGGISAQSVRNSS